MMNAPVRALALETKYELVRLMRQPAYVIPVFAFPLAFYYFFGISMGTQHLEGTTLATYLLASYGAFGVIGAALFGFGVSVALERGNGWLVLRRASPMRASSLLTAKLIAALVFAAAVGAALELLGMTAGGVHIPPSVALALLAVLVLGAIPFCAMGFAIGMVAPANGAPAIVNLVYLPMSFLGGLWIPAAMLPKVFAPVVPWMPTFHFGRLALAALHVSTANLTDALALAAWTLLFIAVAAVGWRRDESFGNV